MALPWRRLPNSRPILWLQVPQQKQLEFSCSHHLIWTPSTSLAVWQVIRLASQRAGVGPLSWLWGAGTITAEARVPVPSRYCGWVCVCINCPRGRFLLPPPSSPCVPAHVGKKGPGNKLLFTMSPFRLKISTRDVWATSVYSSAQSKSHKSWPSLAKRILLGKDSTSQRNYFWQEVTNMDDFL